MPSVAHPISAQEHEADVTEHLNTRGSKPGENVDGCYDWQTSKDVRDIMCITNIPLPYFLFYITFYCH